ncbi:hypothetical protein ACWCY1_02460 [Streptomyces goshikiensis]|uniref:hypothetical protein n=1 Tax=Streptomyces sp. CB03578 TaxID=1718987 RepID=UPI0011613CB8|nr:hypothetical protein [Streptomyces sp. CB03578]
MATEDFEGHAVEIVDTYNSSTGERVIEFRSPAMGESGGGLAVVLPEEGDWIDANVSIDPQAGEISARFTAWALNVAQARISGS